jgi:Transcriptional regulators containing a DNA-binding HTH domain and an aminotransferase domain (MocR family) and their eukaryotic orthologs
MEFAKRFDRVTGSAIRAIFELLKTPGIISFAGGNPAPECFPSEDVADIAAALIRKYGGRILQYGGTPGIDALKQTVVSMAASRGIQASPDQVIITSGSTQGIGLAAKTLINPGDAILAESPTFIGALQTFLGYEANVVGVEMDGQGMIVDALEEKSGSTARNLSIRSPRFRTPPGARCPRSGGGACLRSAENAAC